MEAEPGPHGDNVSSQATPFYENPPKEYLNEKPFRLLAHTIEIDNIDFSARSFTVHSEMTLIKTDAANHNSQLYLNLGKGVRLSNEDNFVGSVRINGVLTKYRRRRSKKLQVYSQALSEYVTALEELADSNEHQDYLIIEVPNVVPQNGQFKCTIDVKVVNPNNVYFHVNEETGSVTSPSHCYTYKSAVGPSSSEWIPCFDDPTQLCMFEISIRVNAHMMAIASGDHADTEVQDDKSIIYRYRVDTPTSICNIGFAVGFFSRFEPEPLTKVKTVFSCPEGYISIVKNTVERISNAIGFFENLFQLPFLKLNFLFVYNLPVDVASFVGLILLPVNILYPKAIVDVARDSRQQIIRGIASQYFGCFVQPMYFIDVWFVNAIARFLELLCVQNIFGVCEYDYQIHHTVKAVCDYERQWGKICLSPASSDDVMDFYGNPTDSLTMSDTYFEMATRKGMLIVRMIHDRFGKNTFMNVLNVLITTAKQCADRLKRLQWYHMTLSYSSFCATISNLTTQQMPSYIDQWVCKGGYAQFEISYTYNRKRNMIELTVTQELGFGRLLYTGPLTIAVQEIDESFSHTIQIDKEVVRECLPCHTKGRNKKRKKVMLSIKEEVYIDFARFDHETPILWVRVDPDLCLIRDVQINQPLIHFEYMLLYERNISAQLQSIAVFREGSSTVQTIDVLNSAILETRFFYKIRLHAMDALAFARTKFHSSVITSKGLIDMFKDFYGCRSDPSIVLSNKVVIVPPSLIMFELQKGFALAIAKVRDSSGVCPVENVKFLANLLYFNDNSQNRYSDDFLRATYIDSFRLTLTPSMSKSSTDVRLVEKLPEPVDLLYNEVNRALNMELLKPSYQRVVLISCIRFFCELYCLGYLPFNSATIFDAFKVRGINLCNVRVTAVLAQVKVIKANAYSPKASYLLPPIINFIMTDPEPEFVRRVLKKLAKEPPFQHSEYPDRHTLPLNTALLRETILEYMVKPEIEERVRMLLSDLFFAMYGWSTASSS